MNSREELALTYLRKRPTAAARALESLHTDESAVIVAAVSAPVAGEVLSAMQRYYAGLCLARLETDFLVTVMHHLVSQRAASLLRIMPVARQEGILNQLSTLHAGAIRFQLSFASNLIGAWTKLDCVTLDPELSVADALQRIRQSAMLDAHRVFLVNSAHQLMGAVSVSRLLQATEEQNLQSIATPPQALRARTSISVAEQHSDWRQYIEMPVILRDKEFIGVITYQTLSDALRDLRRTQGPSDSTEAQSVNGLAAIFQIGVHGAWQTWMELLSIPNDDKGAAHERESGNSRGA